MKFTKAQMEAIASGAEMSVVMAMVPVDGAEAATLAETQATLEALTGTVATLTAERDTAVALNTTLATEKETAVTAQTAAETARDTAVADANTLKAIVAKSVTQLSTAAGSTVDASAMSATELVAAHAEFSDKVRSKFAGATVAALPTRATPEPVKPAVSPTRLAAAKSIAIF